MYPVTHLLVQAENGRARPADAADEVSIRVAGSADAGALADLAQLDSAPQLAARLSRSARDGGTVLVADYHGRPTAALDVADGVAVADPFEPTAAIVDLLRLRARQLQRRPRRRIELRVLRPRVH